jgi:Arc/MetJ-type ribon-helix-helix transcriptional regulator
MGPRKERRRLGLAFGDLGQSTQRSVDGRLIWKQAGDIGIWTAPGKTAPDEKRRIILRIHYLETRMTLTLPLELEQQINNLVLRGGYPNTEAVLVDAVKALVREQERQRIESLLEANGIDEGRLKQLLREAEDSSDYTEMTAQDWKDIEREGLAIVNARHSG